MKDPRPGIETVFKEKVTGSRRVATPIRPIGLEAGEFPQSVRCCKILCIICGFDGSSQTKFHFPEIGGQQGMLCYDQAVIIPIVHGLGENRLINGRQFSGGGAKVAAARLFSVPAQRSIIYAAVARCGGVEEATGAAFVSTDESQKRTVMKSGKGT
jgi:hypothetical protein